MNTLLKNYRHLIALALVLSVAISGAVLGIFTPAGALAIVGLFQLSQFALSPRRARVFYTGLYTPEQAMEIDHMLARSHANMGPILDAVPRIKKLEAQVSELSQRGICRRGDNTSVSDTCAKWIFAKAFFAAHKAGSLSIGNGDTNRQRGLLALCSDVVGLEVRTALTATDIPLPVAYEAEVVELIMGYGVARKFATVFPLGSGQAKLPRLKAGEDAFGFLGAGTAGMSQTVPEKTVGTDLITFNANKAGGIIRIPWEITEDSVIAIGQFIARYAARQFAKLEDTSLFLADGTATYAEMTGIAAYCAAHTEYQLQLGSGKTKPSDVTLADIQGLRSLVNAAVLSNMALDGRSRAAYYMHPSFEPLLRSFNKYPNYIVYEVINGQAYFEGYPVHWIGVSQPYTTSAAANKPVMFFGDLSYWFLAERGQMRFETSKELYFASDELALRALERIDIQAMCVDAMATLRTAA